MVIFENGFENGIVLSANRLDTRKVQNDEQIKFIQKIMYIFVDIFHSLPSKVIVY